MLTNLDFVAVGQDWPPEPERARLARYDTNTKLYDGDHTAVFPDIVRVSSRSRLATILNWPRRISTLFADLIMAEPPMFRAGTEPENDTLDRIIRENNINRLIYALALDMSRYGDSLIKVRFADGRSVIEPVSPALWYPVTEPDDTGATVAHVLAWATTTPPPNPLTTLYTETHEPTQITYQTFEVTSGRIAKLVDTSTQPTPLNDFLIIPVQNLYSTTGVYGTDDYTSIAGIVREIERRLSQISAILDKHSDPSMVGPDSLLDINPETGEVSFKGGGQYLGIGHDETPPAYLTWDGQLAAAYQEIDVLMEQLYSLTETSPAAFGQLKAGLAESGSALKRLLLTPLLKASRMRTVLDPAIKHALTLAAELEVSQGRPGSTSLSTVDIRWQDGLPVDCREAALTEEIRLKAGNTSVRSSIKRLDGLVGDALDEELDRITNEEQEFTRWMRGS